MAALNFVAADDGLEEDPKLLTLAVLLKVPRSTAFWYVMRWQRLILRSGNHVSGSLPKSYTSTDVAAFLDFKGDPRRLIDAMKRQGYIAFKKGRGFFYPAWRETTTGRYAHRREGDRLYRERQRTESRSTVGRPSADVVRLSADSQGDGRTTSQRQSIGTKQGNSSDLPPDPPLAGGASLADSRWEWVNEHAQTPRNRDVCKRILEKLSDEDWDLVRRAYTMPTSTIPQKNRRCVAGPTDLFLQRQDFLRFRPPKRPTKTGSARAAPNSGADPLADVEKRLAAADAFMLELQQDPDRSEAEKKEWRERWRADPQNRDRRPPWVGASSDAPDTAAVVTPPSKPTPP